MGIKEDMKAAIDGLEAKNRATKLGVAVANTPTA